MTLRVQVAGSWVTLLAGELKVKGTASPTTWIWPNKAKICMNDGPGGAHRWIDTGYLGVPYAPTALHITVWTYTSMTITWAAPSNDDIVPVGNYEVFVKKEPSGPTSDYPTAANVLTKTFPVVHDTKYTVTVEARDPGGDSGTISLSVPLRPWIGHPASTGVAEQKNTLWTP